GMALGVLDAIDAHRTEPWLQPVSHHLRQAGERPGRRMATAVRLTRNLRGYVQDAPGMLLDWNAGRDHGPDGAALAPNAAWQPPLWRALRAVLGEPDPVERQRQLIRALRSGPVPGLGHTIHVVDLIGVRPPDHQLLAAIAAHHRVEVWVVDHQQSDALHPLAASWGRARRAAVVAWRAAATDTVAITPEAAQGPARDLLSLVQDDVATGTTHDTPADFSTIEIHASHGPDRQVEVLRDVLCGLLEDDPTLEPRDVVVACTDLDGYAPHIHAAFGLAEAGGFGAAQHPGHQLRAQIAASSSTVSNPALGLVRTLLSLPGSRATSQDLLDLCGHPLVAHRFGFSNDDLASIAVLVEQSGVRWGFDQRHRAAVGLGDLTQGTWSHALDRMLASVALPAEPESALGDVLPIAAVESGTVLLLGRLAELVALVDRSVTDYGRPATVEAWIDRLHRDIDDFASVPWDDAWILAHAHSELADLADLGTSRTALLTSADARGLIDSLLRPPRARANHGNGSLLFTTLDDVAGIPHRVVCVLGLDVDHFPSRARVDGDDLLGGRPRPVETDPRALARQRLLDAFMSAGQRFVVVTQGRDARTNADRPLAGVLTDLREACSPHLTGT
ncbi:MAG TPA: exodeoxyribonuclease V subunit gamma, partial [Propionibacteriaceae bacterium]|nr:exodeoxyribonuclease V subunit gamma [Propionibacteriaceae bacterium]